MFEFFITGCQGNERARLYASLLRRGFHSLCLMGASDEDIMDLVNTFPVASKHIHTLSLRCSCITDRGLESLLDHLQVNKQNIIIVIQEHFRERCHCLFNINNTDAMYYYLEIN